jgi:hypothetical protein
MADKRIDVVVSVNGKDAARLPLQVRDKKHPFKSGAIGLNAGGRIYFDGVEYQASINFVEVGSKPKA